MKRNLLIIGVAGIALAVVVLVFGGYLDGQFDRELQEPSADGPSVYRGKQSQNQANTSKRTVLLGNRCDGGQCLYQFEDTVIGLGTLEGDYVKKERLWFDDEYHVCDYIRVTGGSEMLIDDLRLLVESGNTVNFIDDGDLFVRFNTDYVSEADIAFLLQNENKPVSVKVVRNKPAPRAAARCEGLVDVVVVEGVE